MAVRWPGGTAPAARLLHRRGPGVRTCGRGAPAAAAQAEVLYEDGSATRAGRARRDALRINVGNCPGRHEVTQAPTMSCCSACARGQRSQLKGAQLHFGQGRRGAAGAADAGSPSGVPESPMDSETTKPMAHATHRGVAQYSTFVTATGADQSRRDWTARAPQPDCGFDMSAAKSSDRPRAATRACRRIPRVLERDGTRSARLQTHRRTGRLAQVAGLITTRDRWRGHVARPGGDARGPRCEGRPRQELRFLMTVRKLHLCGGQHSAVRLRG